jgi:hypothetical protein
MQSILGALLTAGYAAAIGSAISSAPAATQDQVTSGVEAQLQKSFSSAENVAQQYPQYAEQITAAAKASFIQGQDWAYVAGMVAVVLGAVLVYVMFPGGTREKELLAEYHRLDTGVTA